MSNVMEMEVEKTNGSKTSKKGMKEVAINIPKLKIERMEILVIGDSPLIPHKFSSKSKNQIREKQAKTAKGGKEARNPHKEYLDSMYILNKDLNLIADEDVKKLTKDTIYGMRSISFKSAAVGACSHVDGITKVLARGAFHIDGEYVEVETDEIPEMREDLVTIGMGKSDLRYRGNFKNWSAKLTVRYNASVLSREQIVNLFNTAGFSNGVGDWRPQTNGSNGMFHVA
jgi:hypothetical protein